MITDDQLQIGNIIWATDDDICSDPELNSYDSAFKSDLRIKACEITAIDSYSIVVKRFTAQYGATIWTLMHQSHVPVIKRSCRIVNKNSQPIQEIKSFHRILNILGD